MKKISAHLSIALLALLILSPVAFAAILPTEADSSEVLDQSNDPIPNISAIPAPQFIPGSIFQSFRPALPQLTSVDVRLMNANTTNAQEVWLKIRQGGPFGPILVSEHLQLPKNQPSILLHTTFSVSIQVTPSSTYVIEIYWGSTNSSSIYWWGVNADTYPDGNEFGPTGLPITANDLNFQTWGTMYSPETQGSKLRVVGGELIATPIGIYLSLPLLAVAASAAVFGYRLAKKKSYSNSTIH